MYFSCHTQRESQNVSLEYKPIFQYPSKVLHYVQQHILAGNIRMCFTAFTEPFRPNKKALLKTEKDGLLV